MFLPAALCAVPVKVRVVPKSMEALLAGLRVTEDGTGKKVDRVGLLPQLLNPDAIRKSVNICANCEVKNLPKNVPSAHIRDCEPNAANGNLSV